MSQQNKTLSKEQQEGVLLAYNEFLSLRKKLQVESGLSRPTFFLGVMNVALTSFLVGSKPEYYFLFFFVKIFLVVPLRIWYGISQKDNYYMADFCWVSVLFTALSFLGKLLHLIPTQYMQIILRIVFVFACGPQGWSAILFNNSLVFHSFMHTCSVFIHLSPCLAAFTMRWNLKTIMEEFPVLFQNYDFGFGECRDYYAEFFWPAFKLYLIWWVAYTTWLCFFGLNLPKKGQDTVFNWLYTTNKAAHKYIDSVAAKLFKKQKDLQTKTKVVVYMSFHFIMVTLTMNFTYLCWHYKTVHFLFIILVLSSIVWQAAGYYTHFSLDGPKKKLEKMMIGYGMEGFKESKKSKKN